MIYGFTLTLICVAMYVLWRLYTAWLIYERLQWRASQRLKIARDLHDSLLQSLTALVLRFHYATEEIDENHPARLALRLALQRADSVVVEGRERVQGLGLEVDRDLSLAERLAQKARELHRDELPVVTVTEYGCRRPLLPLIETELWRLCDEQIVDFCTQARAESLEVGLIYGASHFALRWESIATGRNSVPGYSAVAPDWIANEELKEYARSLGLHSRSWRCDGAVVAFELQFPALIAYDDGPAFSARFLRHLRHAA